MATANRCFRRLFILLTVLLSLSGPFPAPVMGQETLEWKGGVRRTAILTEVARLVEEHYVFPDRAPAFARALLEKSDAGAYSAHTDAGAFAIAVTADLVEITGDPHMLFRVVEASGLNEPSVSPLHHPIRLSHLGQEEHLGFTKLSWLPGRVGYLELIRIYPLSESRARMDGAMEFLSGADAVILDLRKNQGGAGESLPYLCSFFLDGVVQLTSYYSRDDDFLKEFWTLEGVDGGPLTDIPLFLLVGEDTFSAAEMLAYDLSVLHRAILVGEATGGGANSVDLYPVGPDFELYVSTSTAINPVTGSNWEGQGVSPDVRVPASLALDTALVLARGAAEKRSRDRTLRAEASTDTMERQLAAAQTLFDTGDDTGGRLALDSLFSVSESAGFMSEFFLDLLAYPFLSGKHASVLRAILDERLRRYPSGETHEQVGHTLRILGDPEGALNHYVKALELDPGNRNAAKWIQRLRAGR